MSISRPSDNRRPLIAALILLLTVTATFDCTEMCIKVR